MTAVQQKRRCQRTPPARSSHSTVCRRLGAKRVQVSTVSTLTREGTVSLDVTGNKKLVKGELHVEKGHLSSGVS